jgi:hypothetical protein
VDDTPAGIAVNLDLLDSWDAWALAVQNVLERVAALLG